MRRYKFRLEGLLRIRRHIERGLEMKLAEAAGRCVVLEARLRELRDDAAVNSACSLDGILLSLSDLHARGAYTGRLRIEIAETERELAKRVKEREEINKEFLAASRNRKVLEKLEERKSAEYYKDQLKDEGKALDEIGAGLRYRLEEKG